MIRAVNTFTYYYYITKTVKNQDALMNDLSIINKLSYLCGISWREKAPVVTGAV